MFNFQNPGAAPAPPPPQAAVPPSANPRRVRLRRVRMSFVNVLKAVKVTASSEPKFSINIIIDPNEPTFGQQNVAALYAAIAAAELDHFGRNGVLEKTIRDPKRICFRDGSLFTNKEGDIYAGYVGMMGLVAKNPSRPSLFNRLKEPVAEQAITTVFKSGYYCDVNVEIYCVSDADSGGNGCFATVEGVKSLERGEVFSGAHMSTADEFVEDHEFEAAAEVSEGGVPAGSGVAESDWLAGGAQPAQTNPLHTPAPTQPAAAPVATPPVDPFSIF